MSSPRMSPQPGAHFVRFVGDRLRVILSNPRPGERGGRAFLRTNLTRAKVARSEVIARAGLVEQENATFAGASWRDIPMEPRDDGFVLDLPLLEVGHFRAKAYYLDGERHQHWPPGDDVGISVHPSHVRTANTIYCAFPRQFGAARTARSARSATLEARYATLEADGTTVLPPSGKLRELTAFVPHVFDTLGSRILHLLPIGPTPTTYARMGRFGSPYAQLDLTAIDPALIELDRRTTALDQFRELTDAVHGRGGLVFLDIVVNHTGWGSRIMDEHPEWFLRDGDGCFHSPGAWGVTWGDLVELDHRVPALWETVADALLVWCRRGVDGFRCDAAYMVPLGAWQYIVARVRSEFPDCVFLVEGLGGAWEATSALLAEGGMQWAYSELFQNFEPRHVSGYLDHASRQSARVGVLVHYAETHDNDRLAKRGRAWALARCRLSALASVSGAFGFTAGVEWLADEKIDVHEARGLSWGRDPNLVAELGVLHRLLADHPAFFDGASIARVSADDSPVLALHRASADDADHVLVLVSLDADAPRALHLSLEVFERGGAKTLDLLGQALPEITREPDGVTVVVPALHAYCLGVGATPRGLHGEAYRAARAQAAWAYQALADVLPHEDLGPSDFRALAAFVSRDPEAFLGALPYVDAALARTELARALELAQATKRLAHVVSWSPGEAPRALLVPPRHVVLVRDVGPFRMRYEVPGRMAIERISVPVDGGHVASLPPNDGPEIDGRLVLHRQGGPLGEHATIVRELAAEPRPCLHDRDGLALLTNGRGGMARLASNLGAVRSKYDCLLGANLHPSVPVDRHVLVKRVRAWANADGFITALDDGNRVAFDAGPPARWVFRVHAGDGRSALVLLTIAMRQGENALSLVFERSPAGPEDTTVATELHLTVRLDLEDRSYHAETRRGPEADAHFVRHTHEHVGAPGFAFAPADDRRLVVVANAGRYRAEPEWTHASHPIEATRGLVADGDAWSPGWFDLPLSPGRAATLVVAAGADAALASRAVTWLADPPTTPAAAPADDPFEAALRRAVPAYLVARGGGTTFIAGYPWFLDWGRDSLIAARGLVAAGFADEAVGLLRTFGSFERDGTLPNAIHGESTDNRETSDAPLWFGLACEEAARHLGDGVYDERAGDRRLVDVLLSIATSYARGTANGVGVDPESGLVWSPAHFTWMDTNHPAATPREGYPIELSVLFLRILRELVRLGVTTEGLDLAALAARTEASLGTFLRPELGYCADVLHAPRGTPARLARPDDHLRPNQLFAVAAGLFAGEPARRIVSAAARHLVVPGALRSLAPRPVAWPLPVERDGRPLNDPYHPYFGTYEGDEDTRRKPAYHNGTAWVWLFPTYCEALVQAWDASAESVAAARALLGSAARWLGEGCIGQLPEILDGDAPHRARGCDAQGWSITETLRVWLALRSLVPRPPG